MRELTYVKSNSKFTYTAKVQFQVYVKVYILREIILIAKGSLADKDKVEINIKPIWNHYSHLKWN